MRVRKGGPFQSTIVSFTLEDLTSHSVRSELNLDNLPNPLFPGLLKPDELSPGIFLSRLPGSVDVFHSFFSF